MTESTTHAFLINSASFFVPEGQEISDRTNAVQKTTPKVQNRGFGQKAGKNSNSVTNEPPPAISQHLAPPTGRPSHISVRGRHEWQQRFTKIHVKIFIFLPGLQRSSVT